MKKHLQFDLNWSFVATSFDIESDLGGKIIKLKCNEIIKQATRTSSSQQFYQFMVYTRHYLVPSSKESSFASQSKTDGTNDAGLASSIGSNNHVQILSRIHFSVVISSVKRNVNMIWFPAVILKRVESIQGTLTLLRFLCIYNYITQKQYGNLQKLQSFIYFILFLIELGLSKI